ncbi:hypothetical protein [Enterococcus nangangensis]|uniref:hypothetical protein n=1 Tax=Enterococcus nangangensis TaxID=2559926 RepID=UPI0010F4796B|nr:hypothetical protein [Enterococcus nangangensis]
MTSIQDIVPVNISSNFVKQHDPVPSRPIKPKVALRLKHHDLDITFYNGCDKYLLCTVLKELNSDDR